MSAQPSTRVRLLRRPARPFNGFGQLLPFVASKRMHFILTVVSAIVAQAATVVTAATGAWFVGHAVQGGSPHRLFRRVLAGGRRRLAAAACKWWQSFISHDFAYGLIEVLQVGIYDGLERAAPAYVLGRRTGELASVATGDADLMEWFYAHVLGDYIGAVIVPLGVLARLRSSIRSWRWCCCRSCRWSPRFRSGSPSAPASRAGRSGRALGPAQRRSRRGRSGPARARGVRRGRPLPRQAHAQHAPRPRLQMRYGVRAGLEQAAIDVLLALAVLATGDDRAMLVGSGR